MCPEGLKPTVHFPYDNACFVQWPANNRGAAGRTADEAKCHNLTGAEFLDFEPDGGSNFNLCVFRPLAFNNGKPGEPSPDHVTPTKPPIPTVPQDGVSSNDRPFSRQDPTGADKSMPWFRLMACNQSGDGEMWIAVDVPNHNGDFQKIVRSWWPLGDGGCRAILERDFGDSPVQSMELFVHAHTKDREWPNRADTWVRLCIADYSPYQRTDLPRYHCRPEEKDRPFRANSG